MGIKAGYRFSGAAAPSGVQGVYKLHAAAFALYHNTSTANY